MENREKKKILLRQVIEQLSADIEEIEKSIQSMHKEAIEAPGAMQSHSDTTKFQMNALKDDIKNQLSLKEKELEMLKEFNVKDDVQMEACLGTILETQDETEKRSLYFLLPGGSGIRVEDEFGSSFFVVGENSPIGRLLFGKKIGDEVIARFGQKEKKINIVHIW